MKDYRAMSKQLFLLPLLVYMPVTGFLLEKGFVYCPAYPCLCESDNGALVVNCQYLYLTQLPKFLAFDGRIRTLSLRQNSIRQLPARAFRGLHVESLDLTDNVISQVHVSAFEGLENSLEELHLQVYAMEGLPTAAINRLTRLRVLRVIGCKVDTLTSYVFEGLHMLKELYLQGCRIKNILPGGLSVLKHLEVLNLESNSLQPQHLQEVGNLYHLQKLQLSHNQIISVGSHDFDDLLHLRYLDLSHNNLADIADNALRPVCYSMEVLKLNDNLLSNSVVESLQVLQNLRHLVLSGNNITQLPAGSLSTHTFLSHLDLSENGISELRKQSLKGTEKYLRIMNLRNNPLKVMEDGVFENHKRLLHLSLAGSELGGVLTMKTFAGASQTLKELSLQNSNLTSADLVSLSDMRSLEDLDLSENAINDILENVFARLKHLKKLDLSRNAIVKIADGAFRGLEYSLESLDLHRNYLETVSVCAMEGLQRLGDLRLKENPLICDCRVTWLHNWVQMTFQEHHRHLLEWTCTGPAHLDQRSFGSLSLSDLQCRNLTENTPTVACNWTTTEPYSYSVDANPAYVNVLPTPIMPLDLLGARVHVHVEPKSKSAILVRWSVNSTSKLSGCRLVVRRSNDSVEETDVTFSGDVTRHLVIGLSEGVLYETCVTALDGNEVPVGRDCSESKTVNGTTVMKVFHDPAPVSFTTLMSTYIVGCLMASTLCVFLAVAMRRRRETKKCGRSFLPGYSAWGGPRFSVPSHSSAATSTCYFNAPSISSFEEDGLVVTIGGLSGDAGVAGEFGGESVDGVIDTNSCDDGARELVAPDAGDVSSRGSGSGGDYYLGNGRCSTVSSFRRHLPANYIVTNTDISDDFFFHF